MNESSKQSNIWESFDSQNLTFLFHHVHRGEDLFFFAKESDEFELNPNSFTQFIKKEYSREWKQCNAAQYTKPKDNKWPLVDLKIPTSTNSRRKKVRIIFFFCFRFFMFYVCVF